MKYLELLGYIEQDKKKTLAFIPEKSKNAFFKLSSKRKIVIILSAIANVKNLELSI